MYPTKNCEIHGLNFCVFFSDCINEMKSEFEDSKIPIDDDNQQLQRFCAKLEYLFQSNMKGILLC